MIVSLFRLAFPFSIYFAPLFCSSSFADLNDPSSLVDPFKDWFSSGEKRLSLLFSLLFFPSFRHSRIFSLFPSFLSYSLMLPLRRAPPIQSLASPLNIAICPTSPAPSRSLNPDLPPPLIEISPMPVLLPPCKTKLRLVPCPGSEMV